MAEAEVEEEEEDGVICEGWRVATLAFMEDEGADMYPAVAEGKEKEDETGFEEVEEEDVEDGWYVDESEEEEVATGTEDEADVVYRDDEEVEDAEGPVSDG